MKFAILVVVFAGLALIFSPVRAQDDTAKPPAGQTDAPATDFKPLPDDYRPPELLCGGGGLCSQTQGASVDMLKAGREEARSGAAANLEAAGKALLQAHLHLAAVICTGDVAQAMNELAVAMSNLDTAAAEAARVSTAVEAENLAVDRAQVATKGYGMHGQKNYPEQQKAQNALIKATEQRDKAVEQEKAKLKSKYGVTAISGSSCPAKTVQQDQPETPKSGDKTVTVPLEPGKTATADEPKTVTPPTGKTSSQQGQGKPRKERKKVVSTKVHAPARDGVSPAVADAVMTGIAISTAVGGMRQRQGMDGGGRSMNVNRSSASRPGMAGSGATMNTTVGAPSITFGR